MNRRTLSLIVSLLGLIYLGFAAISLYQYFRVAEVFASYGISEAAQNDMPRIVEVRRIFLSGFTLFLLLGLPALIVGVGLYFRREWARRAWLVLVLLVVLLHLCRLVIDYHLGGLWLLERFLEVLLVGVLAIVSWKRLYGRRTVSGTTAS
jgi:hypothetical protein